MTGGQRRGQVSANCRRYQPGCPVRLVGGLDGNAAAVAGHGSAQACAGTSLKLRVGRVGLTPERGNRGVGCALTSTWP